MFLDAKCTENASVACVSALCCGRFFNHYFPLNATTNYAFFCSGGKKITTLITHIQYCLNCAIIISLYSLLLNKNQTKRGPGLE